MSLIGQLSPRQCASGIALFAILTAGLATAQQADEEADDFAMRYVQGCVQAGAPTERCVLQTIQLASQLHGPQFGDRVAEALR